MAASRTEPVDSSVAPPSGRLVFSSSISATVVLTSVAGNLSLPSVTIPSDFLPTTATINRVLAAMSWRKQVDSSGVANAVNVAQNIQVRSDAPGTFRNAIAIPDNALATGASATDGGALLIGTFDISVEVVDADHAAFEMTCGKGTYVRAFARDLAARLGTVAHLAALRRTAVGQFRDDDAISLDKLAALVHSAALPEHMRPVETALADIPAQAVTEAQAVCLRNGQAVHVLCSAPGLVRATASGRLVALVEVKGDRAHPVRVFNL